MRAIVLLVVLLVTSSLAAQSPDDVARARTLFQQGQAHYRAGEYRAAASRMTEAHAIAGAPELAFNAARAYERAGDRTEAVRYYRIYLRNGAPSTRERAETEQLIAALEGRGAAPRDAGRPLGGPEPETPTSTREVARISGLFALGLGGGLHFSVDPDILFVREGRSDLDPTLGGAARAEVFVHDLLGVGLQVELASYLVRDADERELTVDVDLWLRPRLVVPLSGALALELYVGVPIGFTLYRPSSGDLENLYGYNVGLLPGVSMSVHARLAIFVETGWRHRQVFRTFDLLGREYDSRLRTHQAHVGVGVSLRL